MPMFLVGEVKTGLITQRFSVWASFTALRGSYDPAVSFYCQFRGVVRPARGTCGPKRELLLITRRGPGQGKRIKIVVKNSS